MENLPPADDRAEGLDEAIAQFSAALAQTEATRLTDQASEKFLAEFSRELSAEPQMELLLKALVVFLRSYSEQGHVEPKLEALLQDWWGNAAFRELGQALRLFARSAEIRGAVRERRKIRTELSRQVDRRLPRREGQVVVVGRRSKFPTRLVRWGVGIGVLVLVSASGGMFVGLDFVPIEVACRRRLSLELVHEVLVFRLRSLLEF
ncbi:MAG: hypothetical protein AB4040_01260 [Synechococcus sp.]